MPHVSQMIVSKFLHHAEVEPPIVVTVKALTLEEVGREDKPEQRWVMWFNEQRKGLRLNVTMIRIFEAAYGSNSDAWVGKRVQLYWDANVSFGGRLTGGVRVRLSRSASTQRALRPEHRRAARAGAAAEVRPDDRQAPGRRSWS